MDDGRYIHYTTETRNEYEALCKRCGRCCIAGGDPCANLMKQADSSYFCKNYENRLGKQKTVSGSEFTCVEVRDHVSLGYTIEGCPYFS